jgi:bifunctional DNA-binding transcriptional regulator/antitoxin component of YhaV-PrlF toxin-antitoxin module
MTEMEIGRDGQVALPQEVLRHLGVGPDGKLVVDLRPDGAVVLRAVRGTRPISDAFRMFKRPVGYSLTVEELGDAASSGWAGGGAPLLPAAGEEKACPGLDPGVPRRGG